jgi:hypothetical protein
MPQSPPASGQGVAAHHIASHTNRKEGKVTQFQNTVFTRRNLLSTVVSALPLFATANEVIGKPRSISAPSVPVPTFGSQAVLVIGDDRVTDIMLNQQLSAFLQEGLLAEAIWAKHCQDPEDLHALLQRCEELFATWRSNAQCQRIVVMVWCDIGSDLRELAAASTADAEVLRLCPWECDPSSVPSDIPVWALQGFGKLHEFLIYPGEVFALHSSKGTEQLGSAGLSEARPRNILIYDSANPAPLSGHDLPLG